MLHLSHLGANIFVYIATPTPGANTQSAPAASAPNPAAAISVPPPSMLRGKTIEEIVNKWSTEFETQVREFNKFASEVAVWDRSLIENGNNVSSSRICLVVVSVNVLGKLAALYATVLAAEREQNDVDQSLDHIEQQQKELSSALGAYEKATEEILGGQGGSLRALDTGPADTERDKKFVILAVSLLATSTDLSVTTVICSQMNSMATSTTSQVHLRR